MSLFVAAIDSFGVQQPQTCAFVNSADEQITYGQLTTYSDAFAAQLLSENPLSSATGKSERKAPTQGAPIAVYGHKNPAMVVSFIACAKSGHPYVPLDTSLPNDRIVSILEQLDCPLVIDTTGAFPPALHEKAQAVQDVSSSNYFANLPTGRPLQESCVAGNDTFYILFTSGSTGTPKGVEVSSDNVDAFWTWMCKAFARSTHQVFFNRAPFTFDLSVTDLVRGLGAGDTLFALEGEAEEDLACAFEALAKNNVTFWVSTPSFADLCLADPQFSSRRFPCLKTFFFVGETLRNETARQLLERFDGTTVINGYGPTESTVLITATEITPAIAKRPTPLPVGIAKPHIKLAILDPETLEALPAGTPGELFIVGDTVAKGYFKRDGATREAFGSYPYPVPEGMRAYRTGDQCTVDEQGMLYFHGRYDFQVKLHGYRIELGDIESNLCNLELIRQACVLPVEKDGTPSYLRAFVQLENGIDASFSTTRIIKAALGKLLPSYMVPRAFTYIDTMPLNTNGKVDRRALAGLGA